MILPYLCYGSREINFLIMIASPSLLIPIELSSLMIRFKREYMSLTSSLFFMAKNCNHLRLVNVFAHGHWMCRHGADAILAKSH
jgi:hypothetical protein